MSLNFPNAPTNGQIFGGYQYNTAKGVWARTNFSAIEASTANPGIVQLATSAETLTGTATSRAVTPVGLEPLRSRLTATVADFTALSALSTTNKLAGDLVFVVEGAVYMSRVGSAWVQATVATFATTAARDTAYAKASAAFRVVRVRALDTSTGIESAWNGSAWILDDTGWIAMAPFTDGWANLGGAYGTAAYRRLRGVVYLTGGISKAGPASAGIPFTLPVGFRPPQQLIIPSATSPFVFSSVEVLTSGILLLQANANTWVTFAGISFFAA